MMEGLGEVVCTGENFRIFLHLCHSQHTDSEVSRHLGALHEQTPTPRGFDKRFVYPPGAGNHYNYEPQLGGSSNGITRGGKVKPDKQDPEEKQQPPRSLPTLTAGDPSRFWMKDGRYLNRKTELPQDFYSTRTFTNEMLGYLQDRDAEEKEKPFFAYLAYTAPHWPLQAPREIMNLYRGCFAEGPAAMRKRRLTRMEELGLIPKGVEVPPLVGGGLGHGEKTTGGEGQENNRDAEDAAWWTGLSVEERQASARKMETYAAMVHCMDMEIGRVLDYLREESIELDDTFVLFMSDNGAEGALLEALPVMGGRTSMGAVIEHSYNNTLENIGNPDSFVWYGPAWACASMAPSRGFKMWTTEGGIRCPCVVRYPGLGVGSTTNAFATVMDDMPTMLELAGVSHPSPGPFRGRDTVVPIRGRSWVDYLSGKNHDGQIHHGKTAVTGWELFGLRAIREENWKATYMPSPRGRDAWELYNLESDPGEMDDQSGREPEILARLVEHWDVYFSETGMFDPGIVYPLILDKVVPDRVFARTKKAARM